MGIVIMSPLVELMCKAQTEKYEALLLNYYGLTGRKIPVNLRAWRKLAMEGTQFFVMTSKDGELNKLQIGSTSLMEYDGKIFTLYEPGQRDLTEQEKAVMDEWLKIKATIPDGTPVHQSEIEHFKKADCEYLIGEKGIRGLKYKKDTRKIEDCGIKGKIMLQYKLRKIKE